MMIFLNIYRAFYCFIRTKLNEKDRVNWDFEGNQIQ